MSTTSIAGRHAAVAVRALMGALALCLIHPGNSRAAFWQSFKKPPYCQTIARGFTGVGDSSRVGSLPVLVNIAAPGTRKGTGVALGEFRLAEQQLLDTLGGIRSIPFRIPERGRPPLVYFGIPADECGEPVWRIWSLSGEPTPFRTQVVATVDGSKEWRRAIGDAMAGSDVAYAVLLTVRVSRFRPGGGIRKKQVLLGTGYTLPLEAPKGFFGTDSVDVLMLCGALVDSAGTIVRAAAEGVCCSTEDDARQFNDWDRDRPPWFRLIQNRRMLTARRADLPEQPLAYVVATRNLLSLLLGRPKLSTP